MNTGSFHVSLSGFFAFFAWVTVKDAQVVLACLASSAALVSAGFAVRYYIRVTPPKRKQNP